MITKKFDTWQIIVFIASLLQLISPGLITAIGYSVGSEASDPKITPAGYAFTVWGVITFLSFLYGVYQLIPDRANRKLHSQLSNRLAGVYLLFVAWLIAAILNWLIITVFLFVCIFLLLARVFQTLIESKSSLRPIEKVILFGQVAIYTGWTTVAIFANTASALTYYGISDTGALGLLWQAIVLICALAHSKYWLEKFGRDITYGFTILWALTGIIVGLLTYDDTLPLLLISILGIILVLAHIVLDHSFGWRGLKNDL